MNLFLILGILLVLVAVYFISTYNKFATLKTQIEASIQDIGNQLKRQASMIPNLESATKGYMDQEKEIFSKLTEARKAVEGAQESGSLADIDKAESKLTELLPKIQVIMEDNPEIKSDKVVQKLMSELRDTADKLMYARRTLIDLSQDFNQMLVVFPSSIVGNVFGMKKKAGLKTAGEGSHVEVSEEETKDVKIDL